MGTVALIGNPNSGKTTLFNSLTGARQHVGNWPGVTVEKKEGKLKKNDKIHVIDLPGTYSLGAYSEDEMVARNYILHDNPSVVIDVVDASNIQRNLYLVLQLLEMDCNLVLALNMTDEAQKKGLEINSDKLSKLLGVPVVSTVASKNNGIEKLINSSLVQMKKENERNFKIDYGREIESEISKIEAQIKENSHLKDQKKYSSRWLAVKILEGDEKLLNELNKTFEINMDYLLNMRDDSIKILENHYDEDIESIMVEKRYGVISGITKDVVTRKSKNVEDKLSISDKIDKVVLNRFSGMIIFIAAMWTVFKFTFAVGDPLIGYVEVFFEWLGGSVEAVISNELLSSLVVDGIIGGVGSVLVFIPPIFTLFFAISLLEDSGYMSRAAYIMDRFMRSIGLHGKSFIPLLIGFGCNVPAIMATRTLENKKDRLITILINPFMSCAARLPVYILFAGALFPNNAGLVVFSLYMLGIVIAIIMAKIFKKFLFPGEPSPFVMELPPYRIPTLKGILIHMWERGRSFIKKAGTIIFAVVVLVWVLSNFPWGVEYASQDSLIGMIGSLLAPIFAPLGFGNWEAASSLMFGLLAKEVIVGTLGVIYGVGEAGLSQTISQLWTPLSAYSFMVLTLLYIPCVAVIGAIKKETNSWKWTGFAVAYSLVIGWLAAFIVYQGGMLLGLG